MLLKFLPLLPVILMLCFAAVRFWGVSIFAVLVWALFEGAVRKWVFPGLQSQLILLKDFILVFAYLGYFINAQKSENLGPKSGALLLLVVIEAIYCFVELMNPNSPSNLLSFFGLKNYLIYVPLAFIVPDMIKSKKVLKKMMLWTCYIAIPIGMLGVYQFSQPPSSWVNQYVAHEEGVEQIVAVFGAGEEGEFRYGRARTSSTFSYIGGFTTFLILAVPLAIALLLASVPKRREWLLIAASLAISLGGAATTGARTPIFFYGAAIPLMLLIAGAKGLLPFQAAIRYAIGTAILTTITLSLFGSAFSALEYRADNSDSSAGRLLSPVTETVAAFHSSPLIGTGIGTNSNASATIMGTGFSWWLNGYAYELESARVMQEMGFIGFVLVYLPKLFVIILILGFIRKSRTPIYIAMQMTSFLFVAVHFVLFTVNNPTGGLIYWALVGISIGAHRLEVASRHVEAERESYLARGYPVANVSLA